MFMSLFFCLGLDGRYEILRKQIYRDTDLVLMCFAIDNPESLDNIENMWIPEFRRFSPKGIAFRQPKSLEG